MKMIKNLPIKLKIGLALMLPLLGMLYFAQIELRYGLTQLHETENINGLMQLSVKVSEMVHELQKERGMTAGFLGSDGKNFSSELRQQYSETDQRLKEIEVFKSSFDPELEGKSFAQSYRQAFVQLEKHLAIRDKVQNKSIETSEAIKYYTGTNSRFLNLLAFIPKLSGNGDINNRVTAYVNFLMGKERAGVERALLAGVFATGKFDGNQLNRLVTLVSEQSTFQSVFESLASKSSIDNFNQTMAGSFIADTNVMRQTAMRIGSEETLEIDPGVWFKAQTGKINLLKKVEGGLANELIDLSDRFHSEANNSLIMISIAGIAILLVTLLVVFVISNAISKAMQSAMQVATSIADGNLDNDIVSESTDEVGKLLTALALMQSNLKVSIDRDRQVAQENARIKQALDSSAANVLVTDVDHSIIYCNKSVTTLFDRLESDLRKVLPSFNHLTMVGSNVDQLFSGSSYPLNFIKGLTSMSWREFEIGGKTLSLEASPIIDETGERLGSVLEWQDRTGEVAFEIEVEDMISAAGQGNLTKRIEVGNKVGFFSNLSQGMNQLLSVISEAFDDIATTMGSMSKGDLSCSMSGTYSGKFGEVQNNINQTLEELRQTVGSV
jgi:methyl-accepting chemotaxis protein